jgi:LacI family transcriptional regulator
LAAARKLDYPKRLPERHHGVLRIEILMVRPELSFHARLSKSFERIAASLDPSIAVHRTFLDETDPQTITDHIISPKLRRSALLVALPHHPQIVEALKRVSGAGQTVVQVITRHPELKVPYVGIDNEAAGRMAGLLMSGIQHKSGTVIALCHSQLYGVHRDRLRGFSEFMAKKNTQHLSFTQAAFTFDEDEAAARIVAGLLRSERDLVGIYSAGGDYGPLCDLLRNSRKQKDICLIGHELTDLSATALRDGTMSAVIDQAPETQARRAIDMALARMSLLDSEVDPSPIRFITITAENL